MEAFNSINISSLFVFNAIGTNWEIETVKPLTILVKKKLFDRIEEFDKTYSRFRKDSLITAIAKSADGGTFQFPEDSIPLFTLYDALYTITDTAVNPLIGGRLEQLGYDANYALRPTNEIILNAFTKLDWLTEVVREGSVIHTTKPLLIDVGAVGKGYLVDIVSELLMEEGYNNFIVDAGGDIRHTGDDKVNIGLEDPENKNYVIGIVDINNEAICASATNKRRWADGIHHVLDGRTGMPTNDVVASWVIASNAMTADGLATALFFKNAETLTRHFRCAVIRLFSDRTMERSDNFDGEIFFK